MVTVCTTKFNTYKFYVLLTHIYVFCVDLRTNSDYFPIQHLLTGFYNKDGVCLLRGTDCILNATCERRTLASAVPTYDGRYSLPNITC